MHIGNLKMMCTNVNLTLCMLIEINQFFNLVRNFNFLNQN